MPAACAKGPSYARARAQTLYMGEDFQLQIDSHMRFRRGWDESLLREWAAARERVPRPVITTYPPGYDVGDDPLPDDVRPTLLCASHFDEEDRELRLVGRRLREVAGRPVPSAFVAAGFLFSEGEAVRRVPYDPHMQAVFFGEEAAMSARYFTHGYDAFAPTRAFVFHCWSRSYRPSFRENCNTKDPRVKFLMERTQRRMRQRLACGRDEPTHAGGPQRTAEQLV